MPLAAIEYVEQTAEGGWRLAGSRVSLDSVIQCYWDGRSPEGIVEEFRSLTVEQVYGTIAFYLRNRDEVDRYLQCQTQRWQQLQVQSESSHGPILDRVRASRTRPEQAIFRKG